MVFTFRLLIERVSIDIWLTSSLSLVTVFYEYYCIKISDYLLKNSSPTTIWSLIALKINSHALILSFLVWETLSVSEGVSVMSCPKNSQVVVKKAYKT